MVDFLLCVLFVRWIKRIYANFPKVKCYTFENWRKEKKLMKTDSDVFILYAMSNKWYGKNKNTFLYILIHLGFFLCLYHSSYVHFHSSPLTQTNWDSSLHFENVSTINLLAWIFSFNSSELKIWIYIYILIKISS